MLPKVRDGIQRVVSGNRPIVDSVVTPKYNLASGVALAGTGINNVKPSPTDDGIIAVTGVPIAGTTVNSVTSSTQPSRIRNRIPNIIPKFGSHKNKSTAWLVILTAVGAMAGVYAAYKTKR